MTLFERTKWSDDQRARMAVLEAKKKPTDLDRGELRALAATTVQDSERRRADDLARRWTK